MKKHLITLILLLLGAFAFSIGYYCAEKHHAYWDMAAFVFPTFAALLEVFFAMKSDKELAEHRDCLTWK